VDRLVLIASLKPDARERIRELISAHQADEKSDLQRFGVFLAADEVVFFFEGPDADKRLREIMNDPARTEISHWLPLFDGPLHRAEEAYYWERSA
jgi:hypothetical protein